MEEDEILTVFRKITRLGKTSPGKSHNALELSPEDTEKLLRQVNRAYHTEIGDILLTALGLAVKEWTGSDKVLVSLEGHGREEIVREVDITRTVGWFTTLYPFMIDVSSDNLSYTIKTVKEDIRRLPRKGIGYGVLKYLAGEDAQNPYELNLKPEISFNYLGQFDQDLRSGDFTISEYSPGQAVSPGLERQYTMNINGMIAGGKLTLSLDYNKEEYCKETIEKIMKAYHNRLCDIINHCVKKEEEEYTPSDFGNHELTLEELETIMGKKKPVEKIYPLSPMQAGMLYHHLLDRKSPAYFVQFSFTLEGELQMEMFERSFRELIKRYDIFRTNFIYEGVRRPQQAVFKEYEACIEYEDISGIPEQEKAGKMEQLQREDLMKGFDLENNPLMRLIIMQTDQARYRILWDFHHILMDGWCMGIVIRDFFVIYESLYNNLPVTLEGVSPYSDYIEWLQKQDREEAYNYWKNYLEEYEWRVDLPGKHLSKKAEYRQKELEYSLTEAMTEELERIARYNQVTLNTIFQTIWGIILGRYNNTNDVVFGAVVSGRPSEVTGIEKMVGLFINTIPVRVKADYDQTFVELAQEVQKNALLSTQYDYYSLAEIQSLSALKQNLIDHLFVFENYPIGSMVADSNRESNLRFSIVEVKVF